MRNFELFVVLMLGIMARLSQNKRRFESKWPQLIFFHIFLLTNTTLSQSFLKRLGYQGLNKLISIRTQNGKIDCLKI